MRYFRLYSNGEYLPTIQEPQVNITACLPQVGLWYVDANTSIGVERTEETLTYSFVVLGFGLIYSKNWDN